MPAEFVRPFKKAKQPKQVSGSKEGNSVGRFGLHNFLIAVLVWVLLILSLLSILTGHKRAVLSGKLPISLSVSSLNLAPSSSTSTLGEQVSAQPAITAWQGPIQQLNLQTKDSAPVINRIPTTEPVVFVGIDDGWVQTTKEFDWLSSHHLPFTLFLTNNGIKNNYDYFRRLQSAGMTIQNHTLSHTDMPKLDYAHQKNEICKTADIYEREFGQRPTLFRPPYGDYDADTKKAAAACGMRAIVLWHVVIGMGNEVQFQTGNNHLQPGDIVLMHFRQDFLKDAQELSEQVEKNHLQIGRLEDWLQ